MGIGNILLRGNPAMDWHLIQGGGGGVGRGSSHIPKYASC